jgi:hypothetical protein
VFDLRRALLLAPVLACAALPARSQIVPRDAGGPVKVVRGRGDFAKKLDGVVMPIGKGWKPAADAEQRLQVMLPEKWKVAPDANRDAIIRAVPPGAADDTAAVLMVMIAAPRDTDPLQVDEEIAVTFADDLAASPQLAKLQFKATDSGLVVARGMNFALAGGTMLGPKKTAVQQQQLVYISEDRIVTLQFTARAADFPKYADDLAKIFASYMTLGARKTEE